MFLNGTLNDERFQFDVELFADPKHYLTFLIQITETTYLLAHRSIMTKQLVQLSGSYINPELLEAISHAIELSDEIKLKVSVKPLRELNKAYLK
ncbi:hypothetical protein AAFN85_31195 [Mucilaginibacter sp. CAU 1740]|uniref:hypothetical protein n=1 Tax=Mucilaginibacter sp. CAU 1740 TaxID=3140365 RepID=UPI00325B8C0D